MSISVGILYPIKYENFIDEKSERLKFELETQINPHR